MTQDDPMAEIEKELFGEATNAQRAKRILDSGATQAAATLVDLAANGMSERTRLSAAGMILDRVIGPAGKDQQEDSLAEFLASIHKLAQADKRS